MGKIRVIPNHYDGAQLRRAQRGNPRFIKADEHAERALMEADHEAHHNVKFSIPGEIWERIFGGK